MSKSKLSVLVSVALGIAACSTAPEGLSSDPPPPLWDPGKADEFGCVVSGARGYYLIGNALTPGQDTLELEVALEDGVVGFEAWVDGAYQGSLEVGDDAYSLSVDLSLVAAGEHRVLVAREGVEDACAAVSFVRTHPLYVVVTNDWDDADNEEPTFVRQEELHEWHPELVLTHFVGPYTFTDPAVSPERVERIVTWLLDMRETHGDEIGLHIHPYCNFVSTTDVPCRTSPSFAYSYGDQTGYTVFLCSYSEEEFGKLLDAADELFTSHGLDKPTSFRAGGWSAEIHTLRALASRGYVADTSAMNWERLEEWRGYPGAELYPWCREHWFSIDETSQPYYPSEQDILSSEAPVVPVLEVPDNGLLVDYVTGAEMIEMFEANWGGGALTEPRQYSIGYHPPNFSEEYQGRLHEAMTHIDRFLASAGAGPVVYTTLSDLSLVWPPPTAE